VIVHYSEDGGLELREPSDFKKFKVLLERCSAMQPGIPGVTFVDDGNALVRIDLVPALRGAPQDASWRSGFDAMVKAAAKYGWIDEAASAIKAHVERAP
jgi:hypothetical protein